MRVIAYDNSTISVNSCLTIDIKYNVGRTIPREVGLEVKMSHTREANNLKNIILRPFEKEVIIGCLIGDGSLEKSGKLYRLRIGHTVRHSSYVLWKYLLLQRICLTGPQYVPKTVSLRFGTVGHSELSEIRCKWYIKGIKNIPNGFKLTPLMIAIWFMDDGCSRGKTVDFSVHCFSIRSINTLRKGLTDFNISTTINSDGKGNRLYVRRSSYFNFKELVKPYIQPCMAYKLS